jgi:methionine sulfoxide reductase heme-binding subunit
VSLLAATTGPTWFWYFTRATGMVALILLSAIMVLGILGPLRTSSPRWPRFAIETVHRDLSMLAIVLIVLHILTAVLDGFAPINLLAGIVPFLSPYRPIWLGLGAVSFDLMLAVIITSLVRRRIGYGTWRWIHWLSYASWPIAVVHGIGTGSDSKSSWALAITFACVTVVIGAAVVRLVKVAGIDHGIRTAGIAVAVAVVIGMAVFTVVGPLAPHWSERAGTPASILRELGKK